MVWKMAKCGKRCEVWYDVQLCIEGKHLFVVLLHGGYRYHVTSKILNQVHDREYGSAWS